MYGGFEKTYNELVQTLYDKNLKIKLLEKENQGLKNALSMMKMYVEKLSGQVKDMQEFLKED
ncbi:MAG: hypothetical protein J6U54_16065 [Clostridiales bacterium]|nr:hypothetical protein [Clostridiales bacterium]